MIAVSDESIDINRHRTFHGSRNATRTGRTKTALKATANTAVRYGVVSCQEFNIGFYNSYAHMTTESLDFFVHFGDYIYETASSIFQSGPAERQISFDGTAGAIHMWALPTQSQRLLYVLT